MNNEGQNPPLGNSLPPFVHIPHRPISRPPNSQAQLNTGYL